MRMEQVEVYCSEKGFVIIKEDDHGAGEQMILLTPQQVPIVIQWLKIAMKEACEMESVIV